MVPHLFGMRSTIESEPLFLQVALPVMIFAKKLPVPSPGVTRIVPLHISFAGVDGSAVVNVVYSSPSLKFVCPEAASWHLLTVQLELKMAFTSA